MNKYTILKKYDYFSGTNSFNRHIFQNAEGNIDNYDFLYFYIYTKRNNYLPTQSSENGFERDG